MPRSSPLPLAALTADCSRCSGLCCVVPAFARSADFALDKPAGRPCPNLAVDFRCGIHDRLRERGFAGCTVYDCFGAGQQATQVTFAGGDRRSSPELAREMYATFPVSRDLHELLWYLTAAQGLVDGPATGRLDADLDAAVDDLTAQVAKPSEVLRRLDVAALRTAANALLLAASERARAASPGPRADHRGADLFGADLRAVDLRGATLRSALVIGADLRGADLSLADVTGADLRGADLRGADLRRTLFLTPAQLAAARGDAATGLPARLNRPPHWAGRPRERRE